MAGMIESVEKVTVTIAASTASNTATISSVDTTRTSLIPTYFRGGDGSTNATQDFPMVDLTDATTVTGQTYADSSSQNRHIVCTAVQWASWAVENVQRGTITIAANTTSNTATLGTTVDATRSAVIHLGEITPISALQFGTTRCTLSLTDGSTVTATRGANDASNGMTVSFEVIQFRSGITLSVQEATGVIGAAGTETSTTASISSVTSANAMCLWGGGCPLASSNDWRMQPYAELTADDTVTFSRYLSSSGDTRATVTVVEFNPLVIESAQRGVISTLTNGTTNDVTISSVDESKAFVGFLGHSHNTFSTGGWICHTNLELTSDTNVQIQRTVAPTNAVSTMGYEVTEFSAFEPPGRIFESSIFGRMV